MLTERIEYKGKLSDVTWHDADDFSTVSEVRQVYGVIFDKEGRIVMVKITDDKEWTLPGGKPESGETYEEVLIREAKEEADVSIENITPLGYQSVTDVEDGAQYCQLRYAATIKEILPQTEDPDHGVIPQRRFIDPQDFMKNSIWGRTGERMMQRATVWYASLKKTGA